MLWAVPSPKVGLAPQKKLQDPKIKCKTLEVGGFLSIRILFCN